MTDAGAGFDALSTGAGPVARGSVARVGVATAITAACGYAVLYLAARNLDPAGFSVFGVFWGAFGLVAGAANGLLQESTREVRAEVGRHGESDGPHTHPMRVAAGVGLAAAAVIVVTNPDRTFAALAPQAFAGKAVVDCWRILPEAVAELADVVHLGRG